MPKRPKKAFALMSAWTDLFATGVATATTLSVRVPQLMLGSMSQAESRRMVTEKVAAAAEGFVAGSTATVRIMSKRMTRPAPSEAFQDVMEIAEAATRPARCRVKRNAVRLTKA